MSFGVIPDAAHISREYDRLGKTGSLRALYVGTNNFGKGFVNGLAFCFYQFNPGLSCIFVDDCGVPPTLIEQQFRYLERYRSVKRIMVFDNPSCGRGIRRRRQLLSNFFDASENAVRANYSRVAPILLEAKRRDRAIDNVDRVKKWTASINQHMISQRAVLRTPTRDEFAASVDDPKAYDRLPARNLESFHSHVLAYLRHRIM